MTGPDTPDPTPTQPTDPASPPPAPPPAAPTSSWQTAPTAAAAPVPGSAGFVYADVPNRVIALIIDLVILAVVSGIITAVVYAVVGQPVQVVGTGASATVQMNFVSVLIGTIISLAISAAYFVYTWTRMRASLGMRVLGMQVGSSPDGATLTQDQAIRRWAILFAPFSISQIASVVPLLGGLIALATLGYAIYLLWTTAKSPTKQGFHDQFANTLVVKGARTA